MLDDEEGEIFIVLVNVLVYECDEVDEDEPDEDVEVLIEIDVTQHIIDDDEVVELGIHINLVDEIDVNEQ